MLGRFTVTAIAAASAIGLAIGVRGTSSDVRSACVFGSVFDPHLARRILEEPLTSQFDIAPMNDAQYVLTKFGGAQAKFPLRTLNIVYHHSLKNDRFMTGRKFNRAVFLDLPSGRTAVYLGTIPPLNVRGPKLLIVAIPTVEGSVCVPWWRAKFVSMMERRERSTTRASIAQRAEGFDQRIEPNLPRLGDEAVHSKETPVIGRARRGIV